MNRTTYQASSVTTRMRARTPTRDHMMFNRSASFPRGSKKLSLFYSVNALLSSFAFEAGEGRRPTDLKKPPSKRGATSLSSASSPFSCSVVRSERESKRDVDCESRFCFFFRLPPREIANEAKSRLKARRRQEALLLLLFSSSHAKASKKKTSQTEVDSSSAIFLFWARHI